MSAEAARYQSHDKGHATQLCHSLRHTTYATRPLVHLSIYPKHRLMPRHLDPILRVYAG
jgi:hypothetical protein